MASLFVPRVTALHHLAATKVHLVYDSAPDTGLAGPGPTDGRTPLGTWHFEVRMPLLDAFAPPRLQPPRYALLGVLAACVLQPGVDAVCGVAVWAAALVVACQDGRVAAGTFFQERGYSACVGAAALCCVGYMTLPLLAFIPRTL